MPEPFSVHVDPDLLARRDLAAAVTLPGLTGRDDDDRRASGGVPDEHHGARDARLAARQRSERDRAGRASGAGGGRSYAFRRS
jgi:hypothetical protein